MKKISLILLGMLTLSANAQTFTLKSKDIGGQATNKQVFNGFGCTGENVSPQLSWENPPKGTKSFAVTMHDSDAPTGSGWWHWVIFDIASNTTELQTNAGDIAKNAAPEGSVQTVTDFGKPGYGGPCPPQGHGWHQYTFTVHALKTEKLGLDKNAMPALVGYMLNANVIEKASLVMYYKR